MEIHACRAMCELGGHWACPLCVYAVDTGDRWFALVLCRKSSVSWGRESAGISGRRCSVQPCSEASSGESHSALDDGSCYSCLVCLQSSGSVRMVLCVESALRHSRWRADGSHPAHDSAAHTSI